MMIRSGANCFNTSCRAVPKSPTREQQMQPEFISVICTPASFKKPPSIPISPNSFSMRTIFWPFSASSSNFLINVVFPAPRNPEIMSIFVMLIPSCSSKLIVWLQLPHCYSSKVSFSLSMKPFFFGLSLPFSLSLPAASSDWFRLLPLAMSNCFNSSLASLLSRSGVFTTRVT